MAAHLQLVSSNPQRAPGHHLTATALHRLALCLADHVLDGHAELAQAIVGAEALTPIEIGTVSTWTARAGLSESQILDVMTAELDLPPHATPRRSA